MRLRGLLACLSLLAIAALSAASSPAAGARFLPPLSRHVATAGQPQYLVLIVMDGFRDDYLSLAPMHHLRALMARGMTYDTAWDGQLESTTPTGHATIATGVYPSKHSVVSFEWRDPGSGQLTWMPTNLGLLRAGDLRQTIERSGVPTLSDLIHQRNPKDLVIALSGEKYYAAAAMGAGADYVLYGSDVKNVFTPFAVGPNIPPANTHWQSIKGNSSFPLQNKFAASLAVQMVKTMRPRALLLNLPGTDIAGHYYGGPCCPRDMAPIVRGTDAAIGQVVDEYQKLGLLNRTLFLVTADHGMASNQRVTPIHKMYAVFQKAVSSWLEEEYQGSIGAIWLRDPSQAESVAKTMAAQRFLGVEGALYKVSGPSGYHFEAEPWTAGHLSASVVKAYLDLANTTASASGPDVLLPYMENTVGHSEKGRQHWGQHGGFSWGVQHIPLIIAGPGVRHGLSHYPAELVDVAPTIERLLGLPISPRVDGVVLGDALSHASSGELTAQRALQANRLADVNALRAHSQAQIRG